MDKKTKVINITLINGVEGSSINFGNENSGYRVAGPKAWGGGRVIKEFKAVPVSEIMQAIKGAYFKEV